jgi:hypothetical protein
MQLGTLSGSAGTNSRINDGKKPLFIQNEVSLAVIL